MQVAAADAKLLGGLQLIAIVGCERRANQVALETLQGLVERASGQFVRNAQPLQLGRQVVDTETLMPVPQDDAALDHILQLADVARP